jgi:hypothetical protein
MECFCDYDQPEFYRTARPRARKSYKCYECGAPIQPGESYRYDVAKWEGEVDTFKTCGDCSSLEQWVRNNVPCVCWAHGNMLEDLRNDVEAACERAPKETVGLFFGFLRRRYKKVAERRIAKRRSR